MLEGLNAQAQQIIAQLGAAAQIAQQGAPYVPSSPLGIDLPSLTFPGFDFSPNVELPDVNVSFPDYSNVVIPAVAILGAAYVLGKKL